MEGQYFLFVFEDHVFEGIRVVSIVQSPISITARVPTTTSQNLLASNQPLIIRTGPFSLPAWTVVAD